MQKSLFSLASLRDLYLHMEWADAKVWQALLSLKDRLAEPSLHDRLFHIHATQYAFFRAWKNEPMERYDPARFPTLPEMGAWVRSYYRDVSHFLDSLDENQLNEPISIPWAKMFEKVLTDPIQETTLGETLFQVTSHTTYHRGQTNMELRRLGAEPPLVDYIAWIWGGRAAPDWEGV